MLRSVLRGLSGSRVASSSVWMSSAAPGSQSEGTGGQEETVILGSPEADALYDRVEVLTSGSERAVLKSYMTFFLTAADLLGVPVTKTWKPHRIHSRKTVLKSAFVHKSHRVQYETQTHYRAYELGHVTGSTLSTFLEYTERNLPEGVAMVVTKDERLPLPAHIAEALLSPNSSTNEDTHSRGTTSQKL